MATKSSKKKTPARVSKTRTAHVKSAPAKSKITENSSDKGVKVIVIVGVIVFALLAFLVYRNRGLFVAAMVNGEPVSRIAVVKDAEKQAGKQAINNLVRNTLIEQEAKKQNVTVSEQEITDEIKKVETTLSKQGQKLDQVLQMQGINRDELRKLIRLDKMVGKMVGKDIKITDKEITDYIEKNGESLPQDQTEDQLRKTVETQLKQQALSEKVQKWLSDLQNKAKIQYFVQY